MDKINLNTLIKYILQSVKEYRDGLLITRLIKFAYLIEVFYYRKYNQRLTNAEWVFYKYGPYIMDIESYLSDSNIKKEEIEDKEQIKYILKDHAVIDKIPSEINSIISYTIRKYIGVELDDLLDYVYYETEPMVNANQRGDILDFTKILPSDYYQVKTIKFSKDVIDEITLKYKDKIKNAKQL